jgi:alanine racemase
MRSKTELHVNLSLLEKNFQKLKDISKGNDVIFMVKANGYGHGLMPITKFAYEEMGVKEFGLATLKEALFLRDELPEGDFEAYVFSELQLDDPGCRELYSNKRIVPVISSVDGLETFLNENEFKNIPLYLKFNTGMNRLGLSMAEIGTAVDLIKKSGRSGIDHLMTHFACASNSMKSNSHNKRQLENWDKLKSDLKGAGLSFDKTSIANSGAIEQGVGLEESHIRPGLMMYGPTSLIPPLRGESLWTGENISTLKAEVLKVFEVERGQPIGYGATPCPDSGTVAIISLGYGDGFSTFYQGSHVGEGRIHGRVNMDMTQLFYKNDPGLKKGDQINIWDNSLDSIMKFSDETKSIPYELFCSLTVRVPRKYEVKG